MIDLKAQVETTTSIRGLVTDTSGAVVSGAQVEARNVNTGAKRSITTDDSGNYSFLSLPPGIYNLAVTRQGFKTGQVMNRTVIAGSPAEVDVTLQAGALAETVTVSAAGDELINTTTAEVSSIVSSSLVANVPLNGRSPFDLAVLAPGAVPETISTNRVTNTFAALNFVSGAGVNTTSGTVLFGQNDSSANVSVDGVNVQNPEYQQATGLQSPDDIQDMKIESGAMNAEFGNGVSAVSFITKSGTNNYHADFYNYYRNDVLDANSYFNNLQRIAKPYYQWNEFGAAGGGPIRPNKLLFFSNYEGLRLKQSAYTTELVPSNDLRAGDFSGTGVKIYNPYSYNPATGLRDPFPGNKIPLGATNLCAPRPTCVDSAMSTFIQNWVLPPNGVNPTGQPAVVGNVPVAINRDQATLRVDWLQSSRSLIYGRFTWSDAQQTQGQLQPLEGQTNPYGSDNAVMHWAQQLSSSVSNDVMIGYSRTIWGHTPNLSVPFLGPTLGIQNTVPMPGGPTLNGTPYTLDAPSSCCSLTATGNRIEIKDDLSLARGRHNIKFGGDGISTRFTYPIQSSWGGAFSFAARWSAACPSGNTKCNQALGSASQGGLAYADLLLGAFTTASLTREYVPYNGRQIYYGLYAQDSWRLTRNLTVNYGVRYEHWTPWYLPNHATVGFDFSTGQIRYELQNPLDIQSASKCYGGCAPLNPGVPAGNYTVSNLDFAPRVGLAYNPFSHTVVHAAFGIYFDGNWNNNIFSSSQAGSQPFIAQYSTTSDVSSPLPPSYVSEQFPATGVVNIPQPNSKPVSSFNFIWPRVPAPTVYKWSASVQQELGSHWSVEVVYAGSHNIHEPEAINVNAAALPQGSLASVSLQGRRPYTQWGPVSTNFAPIGWSRYNGMIASIHNRSWHNLTLMAHYTWQKAISPIQNGAGTTGMSDYRNPYLFTGPSPITPKNMLVAGYSYQLPFGRGQQFGGNMNPILDGIAGGWLLSGISIFSTGSPMPVTTADQSNTGNGPNLVSQVSGCDPRNVPGGKTRLQWFNKACFVNPAYGTYGNSRFGAITEPGINNWDISLGKSFAIRYPGDGWRLQVRSDFFNIFNHTQWGAPTENMTSTTYDQITTTRDPRIVQVSARIAF